MRNKLSLLGNFFSSCASRIGSSTCCFFSSTFSTFSGTSGSSCCFISSSGGFSRSIGSFVSSFVSYNSGVFSWLCTSRKSRNSKREAARYGEHFTEVGFGSHLKYPLWMN